VNCSFSIYFLYFMYGVIVNKYAITFQLKADYTQMCIGSYACISRFVDLDIQYLIF